MREAQYQQHVRRRLQDTFPGGCLVLKNDANLMQGIPDLSFFIPTGFAGFLEVKISENAPTQPNQLYYISMLQNLGFFAEIIFPENEEEVFRAAVRQASRHRR